MAIVIATEAFHVVTGGLSVFVAKGDCYDSAQAIVVASPGKFGVLPAGTAADHKHPGN